MLTPVRWLSDLLRRGGFASDVAVLSSGTVASQIIVIASGVIVARIYSQADIGTFGVFASLTGVLGSVACLRYEAAIVLPDSDEDALDLRQFCVALAVVMAGVITAAMLWSRGWLSDALHIASAGAWLWLVGPAAGLVGVTLVFQSWLSRLRRFPFISAGRIAQVATMSGVQIGASPLGAIGLIGSLVAGLVVHVALLWRSAGRVRSPRHSALRALLVRHWRFPAFAAPGLLFVTFATEGLPLLLAALFSPASAGAAWLTQRTLALPVSLIGQSTTTVFYQRLANASRDSMAGALVVRVFVALLVIGIAPVIVVILFAPGLYALVFGPGWDEAATFAQLLAPRYLIVLAAFPLTTVGLVYRKQWQVAVWQAFSVTLPGVSLWVAAPLGSVAAIGAYSATGVVTYVVLVILALRWVGVSGFEVPVMMLRELGALAKAAIGYIGRRDKPKRRVAE